jgi:hypothetical protein
MAVVSHLHSCEKHAYLKFTFVYLVAFTHSRIMLIGNPDEPVSCGRIGFLIMKGISDDRTSPRSQQ